MEIKVYNAYDNKIVGAFTSMKSAKSWISKRAADWNYGIFRTWQEGNKRFYDVGPRVFYIEFEESYGQLDENIL